MQRNKSAAFYKQNPKDIDRSLLTVIPEAPRIAAQNLTPNFDWTMIADIDSKNFNNVIINASVVTNCS